MTLPEDTVLENRYRIDRLLGQGGMGAIYRGFDTRLKRQVAIKENFFQTPQAIQQFEREAVMLADLHHPNLPRVGDHFSFEGQQYLVMDFIEGLDLWEMVKQQDHPLSENQALDYLIQVCKAVQYLHERNPPIIHRDIKPQNIKITPEGKAILVDFGIAKMAEGEERTRTGARGVTPGFSPLEQYAGSGTSPVSDVYSLGATLYALLTGQKPPDSASRVVDEAKFVPPVKLNASLTERVSQAIEHAMEPKPADRPSSVADWQRELEAIRDQNTPAMVDQAAPMEDATVMAAAAPPPPAPVPQTAPVTAAPAQPVAGKKPPWLLIGGGVVVLVIAAIAFFAMSGSPAPTPTEPPLEAAAPTIDTEATIEAAVNATATALVASGQDEVGTEATVAAMFTAAAEDEAAAAAQATETPTPAPTDTPPLPTATDTPTQAAPTNTPIPPTDTPEPPTDTPTPVPPTATPIPSTPTPSLGRIAISSDRDGNNEIYVMNADGSDQTRMTNTPADDRLPAWSPDGSQLAFDSNRDGNVEIYIMNADGSGQTRLTNNPADDDNPDWSPDGSQLAFQSERDGNIEIYIMNADGSGQTNLTNNPADDGAPVWSPDGSQLVFFSNRDDNFEIYIMNADGSGQTRLTNNPALDIATAWSPDGSQLVFFSDRDGDREIYVMNVDGSGQTRLTNNPAGDFTATWSPDGSQLAFMSDRDGNFEIYIMNADGSGQTNLTNNPADDRVPAWSP